ncbi:putative membrane protein [Anaerosolibacter carboniphilus]|uniref:Putative membrane protein n=2 Tax=Anaerosolibacter carboniphilus TaxID=1417629 RepID=A0A841L100_9FIRM|nr:putative membrane protein [Anaerosolibacter carboniphilus]
MFLFPLISFIVVIWLVVFIMNTLTTNSHNDRSNNSNTNRTSTQSNRPMEILKERYAKGEISEEEYLKVKRNLE